MKIALVIERMDTARGGRETSTAQIAAELARRGHDVTVLCQAGQLDDPAVTVRQLGRRGVLRVSRLRHFVAEVRREIANGGYDIVHATLPVAGANIYQPRGGTIPGQIHASLRRRPWLTRPIVALAGSGNLCRRELGRQEARLVADGHVRCLAVSRMVAEEFARYYCRRDGVRVIFNAVDSPPADLPDRAEWRQQTRYQLGATPQTLVFLTVAVNFALKGVAETIECFARFCHSRPGRRDARLVIVGREMVENYHRHATLRDVGPLVAFVPPTGEIFRWYAAADVCVLLSWYDPASRVVLEAARWGIPSITTAYNGSAEVLTDGAGIVVPSPAARSAIVGAMEQMGDGQRRATCAQKCLELAPALGMRRHVDQLLEVYQEVAAGA